MNLFRHTLVSIFVVAASIYGFDVRVRSLEQSRAGSIDRTVAARHTKPGPAPKHWRGLIGEYGPDVEFLETAFQQTLMRCSVDRRKMVIAGHSDGGSYALSFGIGVGENFGHIIAMSPGVMNPVAANRQPAFSRGTATMRDRNADGPVSDTHAG